MIRFRTIFALAVAVVVGGVGEGVFASDDGARTGTNERFSLATRAGTSPMLSLRNSRESIVNRAAKELDSENWQKGIELARKALESRNLSPEGFPLAHNNLCIGLSFMQQPEEAIPHCDIAVDGRPRQWEFYNNRAIAHYFRGDYERSLVDYYMAMTFSRSQEVLLENIHLTLKARQTGGLGVRDSNT